MASGEGFVIRPEKGSGGRLTPTEVTQIRETRVTQPYLLQARNGRVRNAYFFDWKARVNQLDLVYRGDIQTLFPNETSTVELAKIANIVQTGLDDFSRLASSTLATTRVEPETDEQDDIVVSKVREAAYSTYWHMGHGVTLLPKLFQDLAGTGTCFLRVRSGENGYPEPYRIDPRGCYPTFLNGRLVDLLVVERMVTRDAERKYGQTLIDDGREWALHTNWCEVIEFYDRSGVYTVVVGITDAGDVAGPLLDISRDLEGPWDSVGSVECGRLPVVGVSLDTFDGHYRGMFDQLAGIFNARNRLVTLVLDYADKVIYAPKVATEDVENADQPEGPSVVYKVRPPGTTDSIKRLPPAGEPMQIFQLLELLNQEERNAAARPAARQGLTGKLNIASGSLLNAAQGEMSTAIEHLQEKVAYLRQQWNSLAAFWDETYLDQTKRLVHAVGTTKTYRPSQLWKGNYLNRVTYGIGAGMDKYNQRVAVIQAFTNGLLPLELAMEQLEEITDVQGAIHRIEYQTVKKMFMEKVLPVLPPEQLTELIRVMGVEGKSFEEGIEAVSAVQQQQQAAAQAAGQPQGQVSGKASAAQQALALQKGATGPQGAAGEAAVDPLQEFSEMNPPTADNVMVRPGGAGM